MRKLSLAVFTLGAAFAGSMIASAQSNVPTHHKKVYGYQDEQTGTFHPLTRVTPDVTTPATTGEIEVTITITLKTPVPTGGSVLCATEISATSENLTTASIVDYEETADTVAKVTGTTAVCTVNTPYSWVFPAASTTVLNEVSGGYTVTILPAPSSSISEALPEGRSSDSQFLHMTKVPATGTISKYTVAATL